MICRSALAACLLVMMAAAVQAQELQINGVADFSELRHSYYLAGLYVERPSEDPKTLLESDQRKRLVIKVTTDRWSPRRFSSQWSRSLLINNNGDALNVFGEAVIEFNNLLQGDVVRGDTLEVERQSDDSTEVRLNGVTLMNVARSGFTELILRTWVGARPPSSDFKQQILGQDNSAERTARFKALGPSQERVAAIEAWKSGDVELAATDDSETSEQSAESDFDPGLAPPSGDTVAVRATTPRVAATTEPVMDSQPEMSQPVPAVSKPAPAAKPAAPAKPDQKPAPAVVKNAVPDTDQPETDKTQVATAEESAEERGLSTEEQQALVELYQNMVVRKILGQVQYPDYALRRGLEGVVQLRVNVDRQGDILEIKEIKSTRYDILNEAGRRAVERVGQFPRVPAALPGSIISVEVPIRFKLR